MSTQDLFSTYSLKIIYLNDIVIELQVSDTVSKDLVLPVESVLSFNRNSRGCVVRVLFVVKDPNIVFPS